MGKAQEAQAAEKRAGRQEPRVAQGEGAADGRKMSGLVGESASFVADDAVLPASSECDGAEEGERFVGQVIKLDRGFPLVRLLGAGADRAPLRCEHAISLVKGKDYRAVVGDFVDVLVPFGHDKGIIESVRPRTRAFVRKDPTERAIPQVLAANFDRVIVAQPLSDVNVRRLERELVLAYETGAEVTVVLTKADLAESERQVQQVRQRVQQLAGPDVRTLVVSSHDPESVQAVRELVGEGTTAVLIGKSGVGKSSLVNMLVGSNIQETTPVREDGKGRHTTVSREMVRVPGGGYVVDMPGVRGLGLWNADEGIGAAFADVEALAEQCRFRDCKHENEPGCTVRAAVESGELSAERFASYRALRQETAALANRREQARRARGEKVSDKKTNAAARTSRKRRR
ncbi:ribosome small subunit-dependent GTPase A [Adlercreutzia aquisgranensis]|uniref:ribosome small subunit-dependent GTPase A n=1 Tax=Adlercreutzia aquisgranensis TaxID=2941323 RepID=UPI00203C021E|nr:ribosome small subunit-dependent GTPase A [Adlercreutzia aquisgranensis]